MQKISNRPNSQKGDALVLVLILLLLGSLIIAPLLGFMGTGVKAGKIFSQKTESLYAADAGIEDALWQIKYEHLTSTFTSPAYDTYDYSSTWRYTLPERPNISDVNISIENAWIPKGLSVPDKDQARDIIEDGKLVVTGSCTGASTYHIKITYFPGPGEALHVQKIGVWLPPPAIVINRAAAISRRNR